MIILDDFFTSNINNLDNLNDMRYFEMINLNSEGPTNI